LKLPQEIATSNILTNTFVANSVPDQVVLMQKINECVGTESVYDWFDYFISKQQPWENNIKSCRSKRSKANADKTDKAVNTSINQSMNQSMINESFVSTTETTFKNKSTKTKRTKKMKILHGSTHISNESDNMVVVNEVETEVENEEEEEGNINENYLSDEDLLQMRCRFTTAMSDLHTCGLIRTKGSEGVTRNCYWMIES
jgi:hypothetical protein